MREAAALRKAGRDELQAELWKHGAKIAQIKQMIRALDFVISGERTPSAFSANNTPKHFESPMAAYFGDTHPNVQDILGAGRNAESSPSNICNYKKMNLPCPSPLVANDNCLCNSPMSNVFSADSGVNLMRSKVSRESGLPCKSPMSAYFDGDESADFFVPAFDRDTRVSLVGESSAHAPTFPNTNVSPCSADSSGGSANVAPCVPPGVFSGPKKPTIPLQNNAGHQVSSASSVRSALYNASKSRSNRVSWADNSTRKTALQLVELIDVPVPLPERVWQKSQDSKGTFEVQKAIEDCSNDDERIALVSELRGHVFEATQCPHANHVLRKVITSIPEHADFIIAELLSHSKYAIVETARHRFGCRILEGLLSHCTAQRLGCVVERLMVDAISLCTHMYGNFVMQCLLEQRHLDESGRLHKLIHANLAIIGGTFYGSAVVCKALLHGIEVERLRLSRAIISVQGLLPAIVRHRHGKGSSDIILATLQGSEREMARAQFSVPPLKIAKHARSATVTYPSSLPP
jgi:hypothetical protein